MRDTNFPLQNVLKCQATYVENSTHISFFPYSTFIFMTHMQRIVERHKREQLSRFYEGWMCADGCEEWNKQVEI